MTGWCFLKHYSDWFKLLCVGSLLQKPGVGGWWCGEYGGVGDWHDNSNQDNCSSNKHRFGSKKKARSCTYHCTNRSRWMAWWVKLVYVRKPNWAQIAKCKKCWPEQSSITDFYTTPPLCQASCTSHWTCSDWSPADHSPALHAVMPERPKKNPASSGDEQSRKCFKLFSGIWWKGD